MEDLPTKYCEGIVEAVISDNNYKYETAVSKLDDYAEKEIKKLRIMVETMTRRNGELIQEVKALRQRNVSGAAPTVRINLNLSGDVAVSARVHHRGSNSGNASANGNSNIISSSASVAANVGGVDGISNGASNIIGSPDFRAANFHGMIYNVSDEAKNNVESIGSIPRFRGMETDEAKDDINSNVISSSAARVGTGFGAARVGGDIKMNGNTSHEREIKGKNYFSFNC